MFRLTACIIALVLLIPLVASAQQVGDGSFVFENENPAFSEGDGPAVCIDEAHHNFHTAVGRYKPFADLIQTDGYKVVRYNEPFSRNALATCDALVIANALAAENEEEWSLPHASAFAREEMRELMHWIREGGSLLLIADHAPLAGAAQDLGAVLGLLMTNVYTDAKPGSDIFDLDSQTLKPHPLTEGRNEDEKVDHVMTFTGQAVQITQGWEPILVFGSGALARFNLEQAFQQGARENWPSFSIEGWVHAAAREWDQGRIVFLGEAAMCTSQLAGPQRTPFGMAHPEATQNAQFCLNSVRWLTRVISP